MAKESIANRDKEEGWSKGISQGAEALRRLAETGLSLEDLQLPIDNPEMRKELVKFWRFWPTRHFEPLPDEKVPEKYQPLLIKWRSLANELDFDGRIFWQVRAGFTLKIHAPVAGPCYKKWQRLQDWGSQNDEPTKDSLVIWIPRLLAGSKSKNVPSQLALMAQTRSRLGLPEHHLKSFGSAALLSGLILAHFKRTGERTPLNREWTRTDTLHVDGHRLFLGDFDETGLYCGDGYWDEGGGGDLGFFPLGVELGS